MTQLPEEFDEWSVPARRAYLSNAVTQKEQLSIAADRLDLDVEIDTHGSLSNHDLGAFVTELLCSEVGAR